MNLISTLYNNQEKYRNQLDVIVRSKQTEEKTKYKQLSIMGEPDRARVATTVATQGGKPRLTLVYHGSPDESEEVEEVILECQGYLTRCQLPPIRDRKQLSSKPLLTQQAVTITGLGHPSFDLSVKALQQIEQVFERHSSGKSFTGFASSQGKSAGMLSFSNRYFTQLDEMDTFQPLPLPSSIDPFGILSTVTDGLYTSDNEVQYFEQVTGTSKKSRRSKYCPIPPEKIYPGLLVQIQCSFMAVTVGSNRLQAVMKLRSICILDRRIEQDLNGLSILNVPIVKRTLKRKVGYIDDSSDDERGEEPEHIKRLRTLDLNESATD